jgi:hypothetical protein
MDNAAEDLRKTTTIHHTNLVIFKCKLLGFQGTPTDADWMDGSIAPIAASATSISCSTVPALVPIAPITMPMRGASLGEWLLSRRVRSDSCRCAHRFDDWSDEGSNMKTETANTAHMSTRNTSGIRCARSYRTLRDGSFEGRFARHFVPGYYRAVPPDTLDRRGSNVGYTLCGGS